MRNYQINKTLGVVNIPFTVNADNSDAFDEMRKEMMVQDLLAKEVTEINDYEITAFSPLVKNNKIFYDIYFHRRIDSSDDITATNGIRNILSAKYPEYYDSIINHFTTQVFTDSMIAVGEGQVTGTTYPSFWNSLCYPFYSRKAAWFSDKEQQHLKPKRFDPSSYVYNSFIKMNFFTTPYPATQELLFQNVIYVNPRWCKDMEGDANGSWVRPRFSLDNTTDGYYLYWLNDYNVSTFYVSFEFWDALNGVSIVLMPTSDATQYKQWVWGVNNEPVFDSRMMYMEYKLRYSNHIYTMGEFNRTTKKWDIYPSDIKLYQVVFDNYFAPRNPNIHMSTEAFQVPSVTPPSSVFDIELMGIGAGNKLTLLSGNDQLIIPHTTPLYFNEVRDWLDTIPLRLSDSSETVTIKNNSEVEVFLKDVQFQVINSDSRPRLYGDRKDLLSNNTATRYMFLSVPYADREGEEVQPLFQDYYDAVTYPENTISDPSDTISISPGCTEVPCYWESKRNMRWFYPITVSNLNTFGTAFAERLFIMRDGNDVAPISPGQELPLTISWDVGKDYSTVYIEPQYYALTPRVNPNRELPKIFYNGKKYKITLDYRINLVFNDLHNTLPDTIVSFDVAVAYLVKYVYGGNTGGGNGEEPGEEPGGKPGHSGWDTGGPA